VKDDEIKQLNDLRLDKDKIIETAKEGANIDEIYSRREGSLFEKLVAKSLRMEVGKNKFSTDGYAKYIKLETDDFKNKIVKEKVREIQGKICMILAEDLAILADEIILALENYNGENLDSYLNKELSKTPLIEDKSKKE
jgi:hypothetical protein